MINRKYKTKLLEKSDLVHIDSLVKTLNSLSETPEITQQQAEQILDNITQQNSKIFIVIDNEDGIIWAVTLLIEQKILRGWAKAGHIEDVVTRKWFEWRWIASSLINKAIEKATQEGCYKVILDCEAELCWYYKRFWFIECWVFMRNYL